MWQDWLLAAMQFVFIGALIPTMLHSHKKPPLSTGLVITGGVATISFVYVTLGFWGSALATGLHAIQWAVVTYQRFQLDKNNG